MTTAERQAFPKKKRIVDLAAVATYREAHPDCEVLGCRRSPMPTPHHIKHRGGGGDDVPENLIRLCYFHHLGNHGVHGLRFGDRRWWRAFRDRLPADAIAKAVAAGYLDA